MGHPYRARLTALLGASLLNLGRSGPCLNGAFRRMAVMHQTLPAILGGQVSMDGKKIDYLGSTA